MKQVTLFALNLHEIVLYVLQGKLNLILLHDLSIKYTFSNKIVWKSLPLRFHNLKKCFCNIRNHSCKIIFRSDKIEP